MSEQQIVWEAVPEPAAVEEVVHEGVPDAEPAPPPKPADKPLSALPMVPEPTTGGVPAWALWPEGLAVPRGRVAYFARFPGNWTDAPNAGLEAALTPEEEVAWKLQGVKPPTYWRQCIFWALSIGDQKFALGRANGDTNRFNSELAKQMIRSIDGALVDRSGMAGVAGNLDMWWEQLGERCRSELTRLCVRIHSLTMQERALFLGYCLASRSGG